MTNACVKKTRFKSRRQETNDVRAGLEKVKEEIMKFQQEEKHLQENLAKVGQPASFVEYPEGKCRQEQ